MEKTQCTRVLEYMQTHGGITPLEAWAELGVYRLSARIADLRKTGYDIGGKTVSVANRYGEVCHVKRYALTERMNGNGSDLSQDLCRHGGNAQPVL